MTSEISIIRKFLEIHGDKNSHRTAYIERINIGYYDDSVITPYMIFLETQIERIMKIIYYDPRYKQLELKNVKINIENIDEFLDSDDISLVLRYGRDILDYEFIKNINSSLGDFDPLRLKDFDTFLEK